MSSLRLCRKLIFKELSISSIVLVIYDLNSVNQMTFNYSPLHIYREPILKFSFSHCSVIFIGPKVRVMAIKSSKKDQYRLLNIYYIIYLKCGKISYADSNSTFNSNFIYSSADSKEAVFSRSLATNQYLMLVSTTHPKHLHR